VLVTAPGTKLSATIAAFSVVLQRRRRGVPVKTSTRRKLCPSIGKLLGKPTSPPRPDKAGSADRRQTAQGGGCAPLTFDLAKSPPAPIAAEALERIAALYRIEAEIRGSSADERRAARQEQSKPLIAAMKAWLEKTLAQLAGGSTLAQIIRYGLSRWDGFILFLEDGRVEIDSNTVERSIRPIVLTRKNALFAGSDEGASCC
jgi:hypothetical protein